MFKAIPGLDIHDTDIFINGSRQFGEENQQNYNRTEKLYKIILDLKHAKDN